MCAQRVALTFVVFKQNWLDLYRFALHSKLIKLLYLFFLIISRVYTIFDYGFSKYLLKSNVIQTK